MFMAMIVHWEFDDLDTSVREPSWALHADPVIDLLLVHKISSQSIEPRRFEAHGVCNLKRDRVEKSSCDQGGSGEKTGAGPPSQAFPRRTAEGTDSA